MARCTTRRTVSIDRVKVVSLAAVTLLLASGSGAAAQTAAMQAFGIALGASPDAVMAVLARDYPVCQPARSVFHEVAGQQTESTAELSINPGLIDKDIAAADLCSYSPAGDGISDSVEANFMHPSLAPGQPLYSLHVHREFPDFVYGQGAKPANSFDELRAQLMRRYGRPIDQRRVATVSSAANLASSLGIGKQVRREDQLVRYLWSATGKLSDQEFEYSSCECAGRYVKAVIEISRSATAPKNWYQVLSFTITIEDPAQKAQQDAWNAQWQRTKD